MSTAQRWIPGGAARSRASSPTSCAHQVDEQPFGDDERARRRAADAVEQSAARVGVGEIEADALERATRRSVAEHLLLVVEDLRQIDLDPAQRGRQVQPVRPRVEAGGEVQHEVAPFVHLPGDDAIEEIGARDKRPGVVVGKRYRRRDALPAIAGERARERIAEDGVGPFRFASAVHGHPPCGVRHVTNQRFRHQIPRLSQGWERHLVEDRLQRPGLQPH